MGKCLDQIAGDQGEGGRLAGRDAEARGLHLIVRQRGAGCGGPDAPHGEVFPVVHGPASGRKGGPDRAVAQGDETGGRFDLDHGRVVTRPRDLVTRADVEPLDHPARTRLHHQVPQLRTRSGVWSDRDVARIRPRHRRRAVIAAAKHDLVPCGEGLVRRENGFQSAPWLRCRARIRHAPRRRIDMVNCTCYRSAGHPPHREAGTKTDRGDCGLTGQIGWR